VHALVAGGAAEAQLVRVVDTLAADRICDFDAFGGDGLAGFAPWLPPTIAGEDLPVVGKRWTTT